MISRSIAFCIFFAAVFTGVFRATAQQQVADYDIERYISEIRAYKHDYLARELEIPRELQRTFFEQYDAMEDEIMRLNTETRDLERQIDSNPGATDVEIEAAITAIFGQKQKEAEIEMRYLEIFRENMSLHQLLKLKSAERRFNQQLMRRHRRVRNDDDSRGPHR